ncbi:MAG: Trifunctional nucleotide phosphoesterase protein YfkN precursor, partial [Verrucomicrobiota bacterium]
TLRVGGGASHTLTWNGSVSVTGASGISADGSTTGITISGGLNMNNGGHTLTSFASGTANTLSGPISGGSGTITVALGTLNLNAANTFGGTFRASVSGTVLKIGDPLAMQNATLDMNAADAGSVNLNNLNATIGALTGSRALALGSGTVLIGSNHSSTAYSGTLSGGGSLVKVGNGTLTLSGANSYTGTTSVNAGILALGSSSALPATAVSLGNATLDAATFSNTLGTLDVTSTAKINLGTGAALAFADSNGIDWSGGTLTLTGTFVPGVSLRFGTGNTGLTPTQLAKISAAGFGSFFLNSSGYLVVDNIAPTLAGSAIVDDKSGAPIAVNTLVTYTVTFSEDMDASTVTAADFGNAGTATFSIGSVTENTPTSGVFIVQATPTGAGTFQLRVNAAAVLKDVAGNNLNTASAILDDTTITVDGIAPTLAGSAIVDDKSGAPIAINTLVTYTVTFSEDMDATTVSAADFGNAGTATVSIGSVTETTPTSGVFIVQATPTSAGTLQLRVNAAAVLKDVVGNNLNTASAILDDTIITVQTPYASWAGGGAFIADANSDGVANGVAWVLGAANPSADATGLLPTFDNTSDSTYFIYTYRRSDAANTDPTTTITVQYGSDLSAWTVAVHDGANIIITPTNDGAGAGIDSVQVKINRTFAVGGKLFARLNVVIAP